MPESTTFLMQSPQNTSQVIHNSHLYVDPATGTIWEDEHGPRGGDEINILLAAHNYGWPTITY